VLCLLRQNRNRSVAPGEIVSWLRGSDLVVSQSLEGLLAAGLVVREADGGARYCPVTVAVEQLADAAVALYARRPDAVRRTIVSAANPNITAFAEAFRLRKD
jgi:hypothetical protein